MGVPRSADRNNTYNATPYLAGERVSTKEGDVQAGSTEAAPYKYASVRVLARTWSEKRTPKPCRHPIPFPTPRRQIGTFAAPFQARALGV